MSMIQFSAAQLATMLGGTVEGDAAATVYNIGKIESAAKGELCFFSNPKYENYLYTTQASIVLINNDWALKQTVNCTLIRVPNAYNAFATLLQQYEQIINKASEKKGIEQPSFIAASATIAEDVYIGAFAYIGENATINKGSKIYPHTTIADNVKIGSNTIIHSNVSVYKNCVVGDNCILHAGVVVGADGFGFAKDNEGKQIKIPQLGNVIINNNVEVGANTCIDRATIGSTIIGEGVKLDNLVQVGHNVEIGEHTVIAGGTAISGSTKLGKRLTVGGQVGFAGHIQVADGVMIGGQSGITKSITTPNIALNGTPAQEYRQSLKSAAALKNLPYVLQKINELQNKLNNK
jgi:UDP-3-O-[3-hydroxymyristoyl] glucosamine N-acyltransferase